VSTKVNNLFNAEVCIDSIMADWWTCYQSVNQFYYA